MAIFRIALVAALVVAAFAEPLRYRRQSSAVIDSSAALAAEGEGSANDAHQEAVVAIGIPASAGSGWGSDGSPGVPASIVISSSGISEVSSEGAILEVTNNDGQGDLSNLQVVAVDLLAEAGNGLDVLASGGDVALGSSNIANAQGAGASAAAATAEIIAS